MFLDYFIILIFFVVSSFISFFIFVLSYFLLPHKANQEEVSPGCSFQRKPLMPFAPAQSGAMLITRGCKENNVCRQDVTNLRRGAANVNSYLVFLMVSPIFFYICWRYLPCSKLRMGGHESLWTLRREQLHQTLVNSSVLVVAASCLENVHHNAGKWSSQVTTTICRVLDVNRGLECCKYGAPSILACLKLSQ